MFQLPDPARAWDYENGFYLTADVTRISKFVSHIELFKQALTVPGEIVECGVFKGASLVRWAAFRQLLMSPFSKRIIGFDTFGQFPATAHEPDVAPRAAFVAAAGDSSISTDQLSEVLSRQRLDENVELVAGDITETVPRYVDQHPELRVSLINLDTDVYEASVTVLRELYPRLVPGGILILDDYGTFPGETKAIDDYFNGRAKIMKHPFAMTPSFIVKPSR